MDRLKILTNLAEFNKPVEELANDLSKISWDYTGKPMVILSSHVKSVLQRFLDRKFSAQQLEDWANLIECREDLDFEHTHRVIVENIVHSLANPALEGEITISLCKGFLEKL